MMDSKRLRHTVDAEDTFVILPMMNLLNGVFIRHIRDDRSMGLRHKAHDRKNGSSS